MATGSDVYENAELVKRLVSANTRFALNLYRKLTEESGPDSNVFFSPMSISTAFAMTSLGARENTAKEMRETLGLSEISDADAHAAFRDHQSALNKKGCAYQLHTANRIFTAEGHATLEEFLLATKKFYEAEAVTMNFAGEPEKSVKDINSWVEEQTSNKIKDLLKEGSIDAQTALLLVNAIYFKGDWAEKFDKRGTQGWNFMINEKDHANVDMMFHCTQFRYCKREDLDCAILELPYVDNDLGMFILLPNKRTGLAELEGKLTAQHLVDLTTKMRKTKVEAYIPRFKLDYDCSLNETLSAMGMKDLFVDGQADLSGIDGSKRLFVSQAVHKAFLEVNEEGSEAAAATAIQISLTCLGNRIEFYAQHPFLFLIRDNRSGAILFMGRFAKPPSN